MNSKETRSKITEQKRWDALDVAKGIGILLVVFTHSPMFIAVSEDMSPIIVWVASFHMPLFFVICGFYIKMPENIEDFGSVTIRKLKQIIIPYIFWAIIYCGLSKESLGWILFGTNLSLNTAGSNSVLWFLTTYFVGNILFCFVAVLSKRCNHKKLFWGIVVFLCVIFANNCKLIWTPYGWPWGIDIAFTGVIFIIFGKGIKSIIERIREKKLLAFLLGGVCLVINTIVAPINYSAEKQYIMAYASFGENYYVYIANAIIASIGIILLCTLIEKSVVIKWIGRNSNGIMILHYFVFEFTIAFSSPIIQYNQILAAGVLTISTIALCVPIIMLLQKYIPEII